MGTDDFFYDFFAIAFTIKNLPTPFFVKDEYPLIKMGIYNGSAEGWGDLMSFTNFTVKTSPAPVNDIGVLFKEEIIADIDPTNPTTVIDTFFVPSQEMFNGTYFEIIYPPEIVLPLYRTSFSKYSDEEKASNRTLIRCENS